MPFLTGDACRPYTHVCTAQLSAGICLQPFALQLARTRRLGADGTYDRHGIDDPAAKYEATPLVTHVSKEHNVDSTRKAAVKRVRTSTVALVNVPDGHKQELAKKLKLDLDESTPRPRAPSPPPSSGHASSGGSVASVADNPASSSTSHEPARAPGQATLNFGGGARLMCYVCKQMANRSQAEVQAKRGLQQCRLMQVKVYSDMKVTNTFFSCPYMRAALTEGDPNYAKMNKELGIAWIETEFALMMHLFKVVKQKKREQHGGYAFAQHQHDCVTLNNHKKYMATGEQFEFEEVNWTLCQGFKCVDSGTALGIGTCIVEHWAQAGGVREDYNSSMQDFADLAVARVLGFEEEGCLMHNEDKTGKWAIGVLERTKNKVVVDGFPQGKALIEKVRSACKEFTYETKRKELHGACLVCVPNSPQLNMKFDHNGTRVAAIKTMLGPPLRMINGMKLYIVTRMPMWPASESPMSSGRVQQSSMVFWASRRR